MTRRARRPLIVPMMLAVAASVLAGCSAAPESAARPYPGDPDRGPALDIQVARDARSVWLTNTTARSFGPSTLWLNGYFGRPVESLGVGQTVKYPIASFRSRYGETLRGGGFFAPDAPDAIVLAELETAGVAGRPMFYRLVVVGGKIE